MDITDVEFSEISTTKKPRILFTSLYAIQRYFKRWVVKPYNCTDEHKWKGWYAERNVFVRDGRKHKIFKKCAPWCVQKCSELVGRTNTGHRIFDNCSKYVPKAERPVEMSIMWATPGEGSTNKVY